MTEKYHQSTDLVYGLGEGQLILHISEVPRGKSCACVCPQCGRSLVARKGSINRHHFAHATKSTCSGAPETALHMMAKDIVCNRLCLILPKLVASYEGLERTIVEKQRFNFDFAEKEIPQDSGITPDVLVWKKDRKLMIEIFVTHICDEEKILGICKTGIPSIEIDLSKFPRDASPKEIEEAVISGASRRWLFHPLEREALQQMKAQIEKQREAERKKQDEYRKKLESKIDSLARYYFWGLRELQAKANQNEAVVNKIKAVGFGKNVGIKFGGEGAFSWCAEVWQSTLLEKILISDELNTLGRTPEIYRYLKDMGAVRDRFKYVPPEIEDLLQKSIDGFVSPYSAVSSYLKYLVDVRVLGQSRGYFVQHSVVRQIKEVEESARRREQRAANVSKKFETILSRLSNEDAQGFFFDRWLEQRQVSFGCSFAEAINDGVRFSEMIRALDDIERMLFKHGSIVDELLNLPIEGDVVRLRKELLEKEERHRIESRKKEYEARAERVLEFQSLAHSVFENDAEQWSHFPNVTFQGLAPLEMVESGVDSYLLVMSYLYKEQNIKLSRRKVERERREIAEVKAIELENWREKLRKHAINSLGEDLARAFSVSPYKQLNGMKPNDYCVDKNTYERCEVLIKEIKKKLR